MTTVPLPPRSPADLDTWLATSPPTDVAIGLVLPVAALLVAYLSVMGGLYLLALLLHAPRAVQALGRVTPAGIRAVAERVVAGSLLTVTWAAPAAAASPAGARALPPGLRVPATADAGEVRGEVRAPGLDLPTVPVPTVRPEPRPQVAPPRPTAATGDTTVTVARGENLWVISAHAVAGARGVDVRDVPGADVAEHWLEVIRVNRPHLRSGDPDVIHPGEQLLLPPVRTDER